ncbi:transposase [Evansella sp. AB-P1]|uniref:transposase n=1 Tax=Evansella sp. AB-P1 TaxID=3037653 RepID=UPI00241DC670|nr:transposase [Evansella sp. AB-P1]MDG5789345.1 transposase [Evansella sp. AB-P1]
MPRTSRRKSRSGIYHIIWRGANYQEIFHDDMDCFKFLNTVKKYQEASGLGVLAWCLMGNHIHLLVKEGEETISVTMKRIGISFVSYYNFKYATTGSLFQDRFKSYPVDSKRSLLSTVRYIHQNPLKAGIVKGVEEWRWSSCLGYYGKTIYPTNMLDCAYVFEMICEDVLAARELFKEFNEMMADDDEVEVEGANFRRRLTDDEARRKIKKVLGEIEIVHVKSMERSQRNELLRKVKEIKGVSQRQAARILGVSQTLIGRV